MSRVRAISDRHVAVRCDSDLPVPFLDSESLEFEHDARDELCPCSSCSDARRARVRAWTWERIGERLYEDDAAALAAEGFSTPLTPIADNHNDADYEVVMPPTVRPPRMAPSEPAAEGAKK